MCRFVNVCSQLEAFVFIWTYLSNANINRRYKSFLIPPARRISNNTVLLASTSRASVDGTMRFSSAAAQLVSEYPNDTLNGHLKLQQSHRHYVIHVYKTYVAGRRNLDAYRLQQCQLTWQYNTQYSINTNISSR